MIHRLVLLWLCLGVVGPSTAVSRTAGDEGLRLQQTASAATDETPIPNAETATESEEDAYDEDEDDEEPDCE